METAPRGIRRPAGRIRWVFAGCLVMLATNALGGNVPAIQAERRNEGDLRGPEGIAVWRDHIFVSEVGRRRIVAVDPSRRVTSIADFGDRAPKGCVLGLAFDRDGTLYAAVTRTNGGTIFKMPPGPTPTSKRTPVAFRTHVGDPNGIAIDAKRRRLYVSDSGSLMLFGMDRGRVFQFDLDDRSKAGRSAAESDVIATMTMPNGLALSPDGGILYVAQTRRKAFSPRGRVVALRTDGLSPKPEIVAEYRNWPDGLAFDERSGRLLLCLQKSSRIMTLDPRLGATHQPSEDAARRLVLGDRRCKPASVAVLPDGKIAFTDFWEPTLLRLLTGTQYHLAVGRISLADIE